MVGYIKDLTGSTTPALYLIGCTSLLAAGLMFWALPQSLRTSDKLGARKPEPEPAPVEDAALLGDKRPHNA